MFFVVPFFASPVDEGELEINFVFVPTIDVGGVWGKDVG